MDKKCEKCGIDIDGTYGSGKYCSRKCANGRVFSKEAIQIKRQKSLEYYKKNPKVKLIKQYTCITCNKQFEGKIKNGRYVKCQSCRKVRVIKDLDNASIKDLSSRTVAKILKRANIGCSMCGWDEAALDLHHIVERKHGGLDTMENLIAICPNCHRKAHSKKYTKEQLIEKNLSIAFPEWKQYYNLR